MKQPSNVKHKVLLIGDSHAKICSTLLQNDLGRDYKVSSFVKPGAQMNEIIKTARVEVKSLNSDDLVVLWEGVNDISKNNVKEALKSIHESVNENKESKVLIINSPHRHDLSPLSCVNQEVLKFNR